MITVQKSSKSIGPMSQNSETCESVEATTWSQLMLFAGDSPANRSVEPGSSEARMMTATSGRKCSVLCKSSRPVGSLVRMCLTSSIYTSTIFYLTWKVRATKHGRLVFRLVPSAPRTSDRESLLWPTPRSHEVGDYQLTPTGAVRVWRTPTAYDAQQRHNEKTTLKRKATGQTISLGMQVKTPALFPTPTARDYRSPNANGNFQDQVSGQLNPMWVEWLMGFPIGWTDLGHSETP